MMISSPQIDVWPQGKPSQVDDLLSDGQFGYLNEQVLWIRHKAMEDSRSALRVPEFVRWAGKKGADPGKHYQAYQVGQSWQSSNNRLLFEKCPISYSHGESPGKLAATVEFIEDDILQVELEIENLSRNRIEEALCHFCLNHRRAPLLGRNQFAHCDDGWMDFAKYEDDESKGWRQYYFDRSKNYKELPDIAEPLLFSETVSENGLFTSVIGSPQAEYICSKTSWPCTDICIDFGDIDSDQTCARRIFISFGYQTKDHFLEKMAPLVSS